MTARVAGTPPRLVRSNALLDSLVIRAIVGSSRTRTMVPHNGSQIARSSLVQSPATGFPAQVFAGVKDIFPSSLSTQALNSEDDTPSIETLEILPSGSTRAITVDGTQAAPPQGRMVGGTATGGVQAASCWALMEGNSSRELPHPCSPAMTKARMSLTV